MKIRFHAKWITRCARKVSNLRFYLRARALDWPLRGMSVTSSPSRTPWMPQLLAWRLGSRAACPTCFFRSSHLFTVENDRKNRSTNLHQVLLQSRQELYGGDWNDTEGICGRKYGHNTDKGVVQSVKKHVKVGAMSSQCWLFFSIVRVLCTMNLLQEVRWSTKNITYSPDIAPCDFWMLPKLKMALKGKWFDDIKTIQSNATRELKAIRNSAFEDSFMMWKHRWEHVVQSNGDYFEGCHGPDDEE